MFRIRRLLYLSSSFLLFVAATGVLAGPATPASAAAIPTGSYGISELNNVDALPSLNGQSINHLSSSYDRNDQNNDYVTTGSSQGWVADDSVPGDYVIFTSSNPGEVDRIFFAGSWETSATIHFYVDGSSTPSTYTFGQLFGGSTAPFLSPLVVNNTDSTPPGVRSGAFVSYVPIPFARSLKITVTPAGSGSNPQYWYQVDSRSFPNDAGITSWSPSEDTQPTASQWAATGADPKGTSGQTTTTESVTVPSDGSVDLLNASGPSEISEIKLTVPGVPGSATSEYGKSVLDGIGLRIYWNNQATPSVDAPLGAFFGLGQFGALNPQESLLVGYDPSGGDLYSYFPMPFSSGARVQLYSNLGTDLSGVGVSIATKAYSGSFSTSGVFATQYNMADMPSADPFDYVALDQTGSGKLVGLQLSGSDTSLRWEEGNSRIYVDGSRTPLLGTGTEDFFGGGGYFVFGPTSLPLIGYTGQEFGTIAQQDGSGPATVPGGSGNASMLRLMLNDAVNYRSSIKLTFQHGAGPNSTASNFGPNQSVNYWSLAYLYEQPTASAVQNEVVTPSSSGYSASGVTGTPSLTGQFEGQLDSLPASATGVTYTGSGQFPISVTTPNNGVILRRQYDQGTAGLSANVYVNGIYAGSYSEPTANTTSRWRDDDLLLPSSLTQSSSLTVKIVPTGGSWNDYAYTVLSLASGSAPTETIPQNATIKLTNRNSDLALSAAGGAGSPVAQTTQGTTLGQRWQAVALGSDLYALVNSQSGLVLDDTNASNSPGNLLQQYTWNGSAAQQWHIDNNGSGYVSIVSAQSGLAVDVPNASTASGTTVQQYTINGTAAQQWRVDIQGPRLLAPIDPAGTYQITSTLSSALNLDVVNGASSGTAAVQEYTPNTSCAQQWRFVPQSDGSDLVENQCGSLALQVPTVSGGGANTAAGTQLQVTAPNASYLGAHWLVQRVRDGIDDNQYRFVNEATGLVMDVTNGSTSPGTLVQQYYWYTASDGAQVRANNAQLWTLNLIDPSASGPTVANGTYRLAPGTNSGLALDDTNASVNPGNTIQIYTANNTCSQRWIVTYVRLNLFRLTSQCSGLSLAVDHPSAGDGAVVEEWYPNDSNAELWSLQSVGGGAFTLSNYASSNELLDVVNGSSSAGAQVQQYHSDGTSAQHWTVTIAPGQ
jgi:hypothetical protein